MIVGFRNNLFHGVEKFKFPELKDVSHKIRNILEPEVDPKYTLTDKLWVYLQNYAKKHQDSGNGFGFGLVDLDGIARTLSARYYKDGSEILIPQEGGLNPRRLTTRECARLWDMMINISLMKCRMYRHTISVEILLWSLLLQQWPETL